MIASTEQKLGEACKFVDSMYASRGYRSNSLQEATSGKGMTFVAYERDSIVGTLTIGFDSGAGLLVEQLFAEEVKPYRSGGSNVCEFTKLAVESRRPSKRLLPILFHAAYAYAYHVRGMKTLCVEVNPRHVKYYEKLLGFNAISPERSNARVKAPAVLLALDLTAACHMITLLGGRPNLKLIERSAYPQFLSRDEEFLLLSRLREGKSELITVSETNSLYPSRLNDDSPEQLVSAEKVRVKFELQDAAAAI